MANNNPYTKTDWKNYDKSLPIIENMLRNSIITEQLLNHIEEGVYSANKPLLVGSVVSSDICSAEIIETDDCRKLNLRLTQGEEGPRGPIGMRGPEGPMGERGLKGEPGVNGKDGKTAYEIAMAHGYTGTEYDWLESLKGNSAYQYAVAGGYTGTEEEFIKKMADDSAEEMIRYLNPSSMVITTLEISGLTNSSGELRCNNISNVSSIYILSSNTYNKIYTVEGIGSNYLTIRVTNPSTGDPIVNVSVEDTVLVCIKYK